MVETVLLGNNIGILIVRTVDHGLAAEPQDGRDRQRAGRDRAAGEIDSGLVQTVGLQLVFGTELLGAVDCGQLQTIDFQLVFGTELLGAIDCGLVVSLCETSDPGSQACEDQVTGRD